MPPLPNKRPTATPCSTQNLASSPVVALGRPMSSTTRGLQRMMTVRTGGFAGSSIHPCNPIAASIAGCATIPHGNGL